MPAQSPIPFWSRIILDYIMTVIMIGMGQRARLGSDDEDCNPG